jgi:hypothetical protein
MEIVDKQRARGALASSIRVECLRKTRGVRASGAWPGSSRKTTGADAPSLVSKGRFTTSTSVIRVGICSSLPKRRYRVVMIDYVGDPLRRHRGKAGCWLFRGL